ncbi:MAG: EAL domain-containing protein [Pseudomonadota bacterium]
MLRRRGPYFISIAALLGLVLGLLATMAVFTAILRIEQEGIINTYRQRADIRTKAVKAALTDAVRAMQAVNQLFVTVEPVSRSQFHAFTEPLLARHPYIQAFNFHRIVSNTELPAYEAEMRTQFPQFQVNEMKDGKLVPAQPKTQYDIVDYIEPMAGNEAALGLDVSPNPRLAEVTRRAIDSGLPSSTGTLQLAQGTGSKKGFLVLMPVYRHGVSLADVEARRQAAIGDTAAVFRVTDLIEKALTTAGLLSDPGIGISVYAGAFPDRGDPVFEHASESDRLDSQPKSSGLFDPRIADSVESFNVADKPWHMVVTLNPTWLASSHSGSLTALLAGSLFSILLALYLHRTAFRTRIVEQLVDQRTTELQLINQRLNDDIVARTRAENALQLRHRAIEASANAIIICNATEQGYPIEYVNPAFTRINGYEESEIIGHSSYFLMGNEVDLPGFKEIRAAIREQRAGNGSLLIKRKDGAELWCELYVAPVRNEAGQVSHFVVAQYDVTATKRYQEELEFQANRDILTGLANRNLLRDRLSQAIGYAARTQRPVWVIFVDLDRFKYVNDTLGDKAGDMLLNLVAERLLSVVRETDTVARLGGDEFVLLLAERSEESLTTSVVQRILDVVMQPMTILEHEFFLTCSAGVATYPADGDTPETLMKHADIAMYRAKEIGRNNFQFYTHAMNERALERLRIEGDLRHALGHDEFVLHFQPQVDLRSGRIVGMEALIRWQHPQLGMVPPSRFIGLAEETGLILPIGAWVLRTACAQNKAWQQAGLGFLRMAVNLSARQFAQVDLVQSIAAALADTGLEPRFLEIELTESLVMTDVERAIGVLRELKALGVQLSIDDFGTGYSSLSYLKRFPIDVLKIDQSFVRDITVDPDDAAIAVLIISLAHSLKLQVIAEGVETEAQLTYLCQHYCDEIQGYFFSRPVPAAQFEQILRQGKCLPERLMIRNR